MNIFCIEQNYLLHKSEQQNKLTNEPVIFIKPQSALLEPGIPFHYPAFTNELYFGCELVLRISKNGKNIPEQLAANYYDAITAGINFTVPGNEDVELRWEEAKAWHQSSVAGMWISAVNLKDKNDINFCLYKNRQLVQLGNSGLMIHNFDKIISAISKSFPISAGDLIFTGSPAGIIGVEAGDKLEIFIEDDSLLEFDIG